MNWRFSAFLLLMFGLLLGFTWGTSQTGLCSSDYVLAVLKERTKDGALNCFEFWFNRYQSLFGTMLALAVALIALLPARGQLREMAKQTAATASASLAEKARSLELEASFLREAGQLRFLIKSYIVQYEEENYHIIYDEWPRKWLSAGSQMGEVRDRLIQSADQNRLSSDVVTVRREAIEAIQVLIGDMSQMRTAFDTKIAQIDYEDGEEDLSDSEIFRVESSIKKSLGGAFDAMDRLRELLQRDIRSKWSEVARNDQIATS